MYGQDNKSLFDCPITDASKYSFFHYSSSTGNACKPKYLELPWEKPTVLLFNLVVASTQYNVLPTLTS